MIFYNILAIDGAAMTSTTEVDSDAIWLGTSAGFAAQAVWQGTAVGTLKLQASCSGAKWDSVHADNPPEIGDDEWTDIADSDYAVTPSDTSVIVVPAVKAARTVQNIVYTAHTAGAAGNSITIIYTGGGTAGSEVVSVMSTAISVQIQTGVSTANQIVTAIQGSGAAAALVDVATTGGGATAQVIFTPAVALTGGADAISNYLWNFDGSYFSWMRIVYTNASSTGTLTVRAVVKSQEIVG